MFVFLTDCTGSFGPVIDNYHMGGDFGRVRYVNIELCMQTCIEDPSCIGVDWKKGVNLQTMCWHQYTTSTLTSDSNFQHIPMAARSCDNGKNKHIQ